MSGKYDFDKKRSTYRAGMSQKEVMDLFLYNGMKNRARQEAEHKEWVSMQFMTPKERAEYEDRKARETGYKDSGYVEIDKDSSTVDRFRNSGR